MWLVTDYSVLRTGVRRLCEAKANRRERLTDTCGTEAVASDRLRLGRFASVPLCCYRWSKLDLIEVSQKIRKALLIIIYKIYLIFGKQFWTNNYA